MAWDSSMRDKNEHKSDLEMAHIVYSRFTNGDTRDGIKFSLGGLYIFPYVKYVSKDALKAIRAKCPDSIIDGRGIDHRKLSPKKCGVTFEHVVPIAAAYQYLEGLYWQHKMKEQDVLDIMPKLFLAVITKDENQKLSNAGLNSKMPSESWHTPNGDPLERYRAAGLTDDIWVKGFAG